MTNDLMLGGLYILMAMMLVLGVADGAARAGWRSCSTMALAWVAIFGAGFVLFTFRDDFGWVAQRLQAEATGEPVAQGREIRIPMAIDGHFWVDGAGQRRAGQVPGRQRRDHDHHRPRHGASAPASQVSPAPRPARPHRQRHHPRVERPARAACEVGVDRAARHVGCTSPTNEDLNVLGMNFLSSLERWGVEGRWLVLVP